MFKPVSLPTPYEDASLYARTTSRSIENALLHKPQRSVILSTPGGGGTLAAARDLAANGFSVSILRTEAFSSAAWSKSVTRSFPMSSEKRSDKFLEQLIAIGKASPGQILLATSDETVWLYADKYDILKHYFTMYQPRMDTLHQVLDKQLFAAAANRAGVATLPSWDVRSLDDVKCLAPTLPYPILIKPRSHVQRLRNDKGTVAFSESDLIVKYREVLARERLPSNDASYIYSLPILQPYVDLNHQGVVSVSGFLDRAGELFVTRCTSKIMQRSQPAGVGVCFAALPDNPVLVAAARALCDELGYFGIFEIEFISYQGTWAAIDFNARLFNQTAIDSSRGMPLAVLACLDACNDKVALRNAVSAAQSTNQNMPAVIYDSFTLRALLLGKYITGQINRGEYDYWRRWAKANKACAVDIAIDQRDPLPGIVHAVSEVYLGLRALPRFLKRSPAVASSTRHSSGPMQ